MQSIVVSFIIQNGSRMSSIRRLSLGVIFICGLLLPFIRSYRTREGPQAQIQPIPREVAVRLYLKYCSACHGSDGNGQGPYADRFRTRPTDFRRGLFKFKSTQPGALPTVEDIYRTLTEGVRTTAMVPQLQLEPAERFGVARLILEFAQKKAGMQGPNTPTAVPLPRLPDLDDSRLKIIGQTWYTRAGCGKCHGENGHGDGPAVPELVDDAGRPVVMPDLTLTPYKQGSTAADIARVIYAGRDGTPMPSYRFALDARRLWGIAVYVRSMQTGRYPASMMGLLGEEILAMRIDMEAIMAWRMGRRMMPMMRRRPGMMNKP